MWRVYVYVESIVMNIQCKYIKYLCIRVYEVIRYIDISSVYPHTLNIYSLQTPQAYYTICICIIPV